MFNNKERRPQVSAPLYSVCTICMHAACCVAMRANIFFIFLLRRGGVRYALAWKFSFFVFLIKIICLMPRGFQVIAVVVVQRHFKNSSCVVGCTVFWLRTEVHTMQIFCSVLFFWAKKPGVTHGETKATLRFSFFLIA